MGEKKEDISQKLKIWKTPIIVDKNQNQKPKTKLKKTGKPHETPKPKKTQFWSVKTEKPNQKLAKSAKLKIPMPPLFLRPEILQYV